MLGTARIAGIQAAKRTGELIPLCHPLGLDHVDVDARVEADAGTVTLTATAAVTARTGVEMEAMTAAAVAALTVYDMVKGIERGVRDRGGRAAREDRRAGAATGARDALSAHGCATTSARWPTCAACSPAAVRPGDRHAATHEAAGAAGGGHSAQLLHERLILVGGSLHERGGRGRR